MKKDDAILIILAILFLQAVAYVFIITNTIDSYHTATQTAIQELSKTITQKSKETAKTDTLKIKLKKELLVLLNDINEVE